MAEGVLRTGEEPGGSGPTHHGEGAKGIGRKEVAISKGRIVPGRGVMGGVDGL